MPTDIGGPGEAGVKPALPPIPAEQAKQAPDFELPKAGGGTVRLSDYEGKVLVLDFWSTTCPPCVKEMPEYQRLYDSWDHDKVQYLGMSLDARMQVVEAFLKREELTLPMALCDAATREAYLGEGVAPIPQARVIDQKGLVRYELGPGPAADKVQGVVATLLDEAE